MPDNKVTFHDPFSFKTHTADEIRSSSDKPGVEFGVADNDDDDRPYVEIDLTDATNNEPFVKV